MNVKSNRTFLRLLVWAALAFVSLLVVIALVIHFYFFPNINDYKGYIAGKISEKTHLNAEIGNIQVDWAQLHPRLTVSAITLSDDNQQTVLRLQDTQAAISWLSLAKFRLLLSKLQLSKPSLTIERLKSGEILVAGISTKGNSKPTLGNWLLNQHNINIKDARITWLDRLRQAPPLHFNHLDIALHNPRLLGLIDEHQVNIAFIPSTGANKPITIKGKLYGETIDSIKQAKNHLSIQFNDANLTAFKPWLDYPNWLKSARGSAIIGLFTHNLNLQSVDANLDLSTLKLRLPETTTPSFVEKIKGRVEWSKYSDQHILRLTNVDMNIDSLKVKQLKAQYQLKQDSKQQQLTVNLPELKLETLAALTTLFPQDHPVKSYYEALSPVGALSKLSLSLKGHADQLETVSVKSDFNELAINAYEKIPGFSRLSGSINATKNTGELIINSQAANLDLQKVLREPILNNQIDAAVTWLISPKESSVNIKKLTLKNDDLTGNVNGKVSLKPDGPWFDIKGLFKEFKATSAHYYFPKTLREGTLHWLDNAFVAGTGHNASLTLKGPIKAFPFVDEDKQYNTKLGIFKISSQINDATVHYGNNWPDAESVNLTMTFEGPGLKLTNSTGKILGSQIESAFIEIPTLDTTDPHLLIKGKVAATVPQAINFINKSPVHRIAQGFTDDLTTTGQGSLDLSLDIPLKRSKDTNVEGFYLVQNGQMQSEAIPTINGIQGEFHFTEDILEADNVQANVFDTPVKVKLTTGSNKTVIVNAAGMATPPLLNQFVNNADHFLSGSSPFTAEVKVQKPNVDITVNSSLVGMTSYLPPPLDKAADSKVTLEISKKQTPKETAWDLTLDNLLAAHVNIIDSAQSDTLKDFYLALADKNSNTDVSQTLANIQNDGLNIHANLNHIQLDAWRQAYDQIFASDTANNTIAFTPKYQIKASSVDAYGRRFKDVNIKQSEDSSFIDVSSDAINGYLSWDATGQGKLIARLSSLKVPASAPDWVNDNPLITTTLDDKEKDALQYPEIDVQATEFVLDAQNIGGLALVAKPQADNWSIERFSLYNKDSVLSGTGLWRTNPDAPETTIDFNWEIDDLGEMLARLNHPDTVSDGKGYIKGKLNWPDSPHNYEVLQLNGNVDFDIKSGEILQVKPGVGRLLGLISLQSLPRRLTLDFSDLFSKGFAFDQIAADLTIENGIMRSQNFKMKGPAASVEMQGMTNLKDETQHLTVKVMPQISDSISLAALAGGPLAGAVAFLAQKVLKDPLNKIISTEYEIVGTWDNPEEVKKVKKQANEQSGLQ